jgi:hypothetical protein
MRLTKISTAVGILLTLTFVPAYAGQRGNSDSHATKAPQAHGSGTTHGPSTTTHGPSATHTTTAKTGTTHTATAKAGTKLAKAHSGTAAKPTSRKSGSPASTTTSASSTSTAAATSPIDFASGPVGQKLTKNSALRSKLESRLKALGYTGTAYQAAYGFKNLGQFVAATNVSRNLGVSFTQLKTQMTGVTVNADGTVLKANVGPDGKVTMVAPADATNAAPTKSLGQSIQTVKAGVDATAAAQTATAQANAEIQSASTTVNR